jgi:hypothetical protein
MRCAVLSRAGGAALLRVHRKRKGRWHALPTALRFAFSIGLTRQGRRAKPSLPKHCQASQGEPSKCTQADHLASHGCAPSAMRRLSPASIPTFEHRRSTGANGSRVCDAPCESQTGPNLGIMDRGGLRRGDARYDRASMQRYACRATTGPPGAGRLPLLSIKQRWAAAIFDLAFFAGSTRTAKRSTG